MSRAILVALVLPVFACSKSSPGGGGAGGGGAPSQPAADTLTGVWQGPVDFGTRTATFRFSIVEDAGTLMGYHYVNDPDDAGEFHLMQSFTGTRTGGAISLRTPTETITASLDGGVLVGVDPMTQPSDGLDAGQQPAVQNVPFSMTRITRVVVLPDAGDYR
jgi:hypothetical protein